MRRIARPALALVAVALAACALAPAGARAADPARSALLVFLPYTHPAIPDPDAPTVLDELDRVPSLSLGLASATQGSYSQAQALIDLTQGGRTSSATYDPSRPPKLKFHAAGGGGVIYGWFNATERAATADPPFVPGALDEAIPGGAAFAGVRVIPKLEAAAAANEQGIIDTVSLGSGHTLARRTERLARHYRLVVAGLPQGPKGVRAMHRLVADRAPGQLVIVLQTPPRSGAGQLLAIGITGNDVAQPGALTSETTHLDGVVAMTDIAPTILAHLRLPFPDSMNGQPIQVQGPRDAPRLESLKKRLSVVGGRRMPALQVFFFTWLIALLVLGILRDLPGVRQAMRLGGLALLWLPTMLLVTAAVAPSRPIELAILAAGSFLLALATDRFVAWPRGPALPAVAGLLFYGIDLIRGSGLIVQSLLGPNPRSGVRFYGIGNELEMTLTLLYLVAIAALLRDRRRSARNALACALTGGVVCVMVAADPLGGDVGGVFTVGIGAAVATALLVPARFSWRLVVAIVAVPLAGLGLLALGDALLGGSGHFSRTVLHANGIGGFLEVLARRYELAWNVLRHDYMPILAAVALLAIVYAARHRDRIYSALGGDPVWRASLIGGAAAAIAGALTNDSGPMLLLFGVVGLAGITAYLRAVPGRAELGGPPPTARDRAIRHRTMSESQID